MMVIGTTELTELEPRQLRQAFGCFPTGVTALCGLMDGQPTGMVCSSFTPVSLTPPLVSICVQNSSKTWPRLRGGPRLGLNVLAEGQAGACRQLSGAEESRFAGLRWQVARDGAVFLDGAIAWFDCSVSAELPAGDHTIVLLEAHALWIAPGGDPLVFHGSRYRRLVEDDVA